MYVHNIIRCAVFRFPAVHGSGGGLPDHARYYIPQDYKNADPTRLEQGPPRPIGTKYRGYTGFRNPGGGVGGAADVDDDDDSIYEYIDTTNDDHMSDYGAAFFEKYSNVIKFH